MIMVWAALFFFARGLGEILVRVSEQTRWRLIDLWSDMYVVGAWCMGLAQNPVYPPPAQAALVLGVVCAACLMYLNRRIRAVEVV
jgi:hypothetical protein